MFTIIFLILKLAGICNCSWFVVFLPLMITAVLWLVGWVGIVKILAKRDDL